MSGLPHITCPCCNVVMPLEVWLANSAARDAFLSLAELHPSHRLSMTALRYIALFAPIKQTMRWERIADLLREVKALVETARVSWKNQEYAAPLDYWIAGMEQMLADQNLRRPLNSHNYLKAVVAGMGDRSEAKQEEKTEEKRRTSYREIAKPVPVSVNPEVAAAGRELLKKIVGSKPKGGADENVQ